MTDAIEATKSMPPKPEARKANPINKEYEDRAKAELRKAMAHRGVTPEKLAGLLKEIGVEMSAGGVANKISRGGFSTSFFMQCMDAMDIDLQIVER